MRQQKQQADLGGIDEHLAGSNAMTESEALMFPMEGHNG